MLNAKGHIYLSFVEGNPNESGFQTGSSGDRVYFYYHSLSELNDQLINYDFQEIKVFKVEYIKMENDKEIHTILTAKKK